MGGETRLPAGRSVTDWQAVFDADFPRGAVMEQRRYGEEDGQDNVYWPIVRLCAVAIQPNGHPVVAYGWAQGDRNAMFPLDSYEEVPTDVVVDDEPLVLRSITSPLPSRPWPYLLATPSRYIYETFIRPSTGADENDPAWWQALYDPRSELS